MALGGIARTATILSASTRARGSKVVGAKVTALIKFTASPICPTIPIPITVTAIVCPVTISPVAALVQTVDRGGVSLDVVVGELCFVCIPIINQTKSRILVGTHSKSLVNVGCREILYTGLSIGDDNSCNAAKVQVVGKIAIIV